MDSDQLLGIIRGYYEDSMNRPSQAQAVHAAHALTNRGYDCDLTDKILEEIQSELDRMRV